MQRDTCIRVSRGRLTAQSRRLLSGIVFPGFGAEIGMRRLSGVFKNLHKIVLFLASKIATSLANGFSRKVGQFFIPVTFFFFYKIDRFIGSSIFVLYRHESWYFKNKVEYNIAKSITLKRKQLTRGKYFLNTLFIFIMFWIILDIDKSFRFNILSILSFFPRMLRL